jgi:flotillin
MRTPAPTPVEGVPLGADEDDDRLAIIIKKACSRELHDLGLAFNSLNIKVVQSDVAEARRRQSAVEAQANADIVVAQQQRRAKEAQLAAEQAISDKNRDLEQTRAQNAALIAQAEAKKQDALAFQRQAELKATQIAQAMADAERVRLEAQAAADADSAKIRTVAVAQAEAIQKINEAIKEGGNAYLTLRQLEMLPQIAPVIADALGQARMVTISNDGGGAAGDTTHQITQVIQTVLAAQLVNGALGQNAAPANGASGESRVTSEPRLPVADLAALAPRKS